MLLITYPAGLHVESVHPDPADAAVTHVRLATDTHPEGWVSIRLEPTEALKLYADLKQRLGV